MLCHWPIGRFSLQKICCHLIEVYIPSNNNNNNLFEIWIIFTITSVIILLLHIINYFILFYIFVYFLIKLFLSIINLNFRLSQETVRKKWKYFPFIIVLPVFFFFFLLHWYRKCEMILEYDHVFTTFIP